MKKIIGKLIVCLVLLAIALPSWATNLRGRVVGYNPYYKSFYPASGVQITFSQWNGFAWIPVANTYTQRDGMYYISLYPGNYYIQVPGVNIPLTVYNNPYQDIPQINLP